MSSLNTLTVLTIVSILFSFLPYNFRSTANIIVIHPLLCYQILCYSPIIVIIIVIIIIIIIIIAIIIIIMHGVSQKYRLVFVKLFDIIFQAFPRALVHLVAGGVGLGVRILSNCIRLDGSLQHSGYFCYGVMHGAME